MKRDPHNPPPDERIFGRHYRGPKPVAIGVLVALLFLAVFYLGFTKRLPFTSRGYELHAVLDNATTLKPNSLVRIAGVNVGKVSSVQPEGNAAEVTFNVSDDALPIHEDATLKVRPRLFLEGNFFLDLHPGSPSAPALDSGSTIPTTQTTTAVQIDEILTALQSDTRTNLKRALKGYGEALNASPTASEDASQDPDVQGLTGAQAINETFRYGGKAGRTSAIVNQAFLGEHPHDLSNLIRAQRDLFAKLASTDGSLSDLITNFNTTANAFADESTNLSASIHELAPTLQEAEPSLRHLNDALQPARRLAIESLPGIRELPATIRAGSPWLVQTGKLLRPSELGNTASLLAASSPPLARAGHASLDLFPEVGQFGRCVSHNLVPAGNVQVDDGAFSTGQPNIRELFYGVTQLAGESQAFDGNGPMVRFQAGGGPQLVKMPNPHGGTFGGVKNNVLWAHNIAAPIATRPRLPVGTTGPRVDPPPFRMDVPCYTQAVPDINGPAADPGPPSPEAVP
ncbi:MAG TPA: MlaD family protein [Solirubrobacterales bacterium]|nr:MlaD family protein [Solirubrobacterales bacterium]